MGIEGKVYDLGSGKKVVELTSGSMKGSARGRIGNLDRTAYVPSFEEKKTKPVGVIGMVFLFKCFQLQCHDIFVYSQGESDISLS